MSSVSNFRLAGGRNFPQQMIPFARLVYDHASGIVYPVRLMHYLAVTAGLLIIAIIGMRSARGRTIETTVFIHRNHICTIR